MLQKIFGQLAQFKMLGDTPLTITSYERQHASEMDEGKETEKHSQLESAE